MKKEENLVHFVGQQFLTNFDRHLALLLYTFQLTAAEMERGLLQDIPMLRVSQIDFIHLKLTFHSILHTNTFVQKGQKDRRVQKHNKHKTEITQMIHRRSSAWEQPVAIFYWRAFMQTKYLCVLIHI